MRTAATDTPAATNARPEPWMTAEQAAAHLGLPSRKALYQAVRRGQVPVHRFGKRLRFNRAELDRALLDAAS
jgi:excisionase family DNA binding protein